MPNSLNEMELNQAKYIEEIRVKISDLSNLPRIEYSDEFLVKCLRARNYDVDKTAQQVKEYVLLHRDSSELFCPFTSVFDAFNDGVLKFLGHRTPRGESIYAIRFGPWDTGKYDIETLISAIVIAFEHAILEPETQKNGFVQIVDMKGLGWSHLRQLGPRTAKKFASLVESVLPINIIEIHIINDTRLTNIAYSIFKPFLSYDLRKKITFHGTDLTKLHERIPTQYLPLEFGGLDGEMKCMDFYKEIKTNEAKLRNMWAKFQNN